MNTDIPIVNNTENFINVYKGDINKSGNHFPILLNHLNKNFNFLSIIELFNIKRRKFIDINKNIFNFNGSLNIHLIFTYYDLRSNTDNLYQCIRYINENDESSLNSMLNIKVSLNDYRKEIINALSILIRNNILLLLYITETIKYEQYMEEDIEEINILEYNISQLNDIIINNCSKYNIEGNCLLTDYLIIVSKISKNSH